MRFYYIILLCFLNTVILAQNVSTRMTVTVGQFLPSTSPSWDYEGLIGVTGSTGFDVDSIIVTEDYLFGANSNVYRIDSIDIITPGSIARLWVVDIWNNLIAPDYGKGNITRGSPNFNLIQATEVGSAALTTEQSARLMNYNFKLIDSLASSVVSSSKDTVKILLTGQSNAWGASGPTNFDTTRNESVFIWNHAQASPNWKIATINQRPYRVDNYNSLDGGDARDDLNGSVNHVFYLAKKLAEEENKIVQIVMAIGDGRPINEWYLGTPQKYLDSILVRSVAAQIDRYDLIVWNQGESDNFTDDQDYTDRLDGVITTLRAQPYIDKTVPFVIVGLAKEEYGANPLLIGKDSLLQTKGYDLDPWIGYAHTEDLSLDNDAIHYDAASLKTIGTERIYEAWKSLPYRDSERGLSPDQFDKTVYELGQVNNVLDLQERKGGIYQLDMGGKTSTVLTVSNPKLNFATEYKLHLLGVTSLEDTLVFPDNFLLANGDTLGARILEGSKIVDFYWDGITNYYISDSLGLYLDWDGAQPITPTLGTFTSKWNTTNTSAGSTGSTEVRLPFTATGTYDCTVYWGDGDSTIITFYDLDSITHNYLSSGIYDITIKGDFEGWKFNNGGDILKITEISSWGGLVIDDNSAFEGCANLEVTALGSFGVNTSDLSQTFRSCGAIDSLDLDTLNLNGVLLLNEFFYGCNQLQKVNSSSWDISTITNISNLFAFCSIIDTIYATNWDVSNVSNFLAMFQACATLEYIDVSNWVTTSATNMSQVFKGCNSIDNLDISGFDLNGVTTIDEMLGSCGSLSTIDVSQWDVSTVQDMDNVFRYCTSLDTIGVNNWVTTSVNTMSAMFIGCSQLDSIDVSGWDTDLVTNMSYTFYNCTSLTEIGLDSWNVTGATTMQSMLSGVTLTTSNYDNILVNFDSQSVNNSVQFHGGNSTYTSSGAGGTARTNLINDHSWVITDGGGI